MRVIDGRWAGIPFSQMNLCLWIRTRIDNSAHGAKIVAGGIDASPEAFAFRHSRFVNCKVLWIGMGRDKIYGKVIVMAVAEKIFNPHWPPRNAERVKGLAGCLRFLYLVAVHVEVAGGWTAHAKLRVDCLDRLCSYFV